jgi:hypothetical protein
LGQNVIEFADFKQSEDVWGPKLEKILDEWSGEYRPFAGSSAEKNVTATETPAAAAVAEPAESVETAQPASAPAAEPVAAVEKATPATTASA